MQLNNQPGANYRFTIPQAFVRSLFSAVKPAISEHKTKFDIDHVLAIVDESTLRLQATNGRHIAMASCGLSHVQVNGTPTSKTGCFLLPKTFAQAASTAPKGKKFELAEFDVKSTGEVMLRFPTRTIASELAEGSYPQSSVKVIEDHVRGDVSYPVLGHGIPGGRPAAKVTASAETWDAAVSPKSVIRLDAGNTLSATESAHQEFSASYEGRPFSITVDRGVLGAAIKTYDSMDLVTVSSWGDVRPLLLESGSLPHLRIVHLIQPMAPALFKSVFEQEMADALGE